eukprot:symbB.v1.2.015954.t2/scaffold1204.1/size131571/1
MPPASPPPRNTTFSVSNSDEGTKSHQSSTSSHLSRKLRASRQSNNSKLQRGFTAKVMCRQHEAMPEVHASEILDLLDDNEEELEEVKNRFKPSHTFVQNTEALPGLLSDTPSAIMSRYLGMSRLEKLQYWLQSHQFEMLWMAFELQVNGARSAYLLTLSTPTAPDPKEISSWEIFFQAGDICFAAVFVLDVLLRIIVLRCHFWKVWMNYIDVAVSVTTVIEVAIYYTIELPVNPIFFRLLRIGKLIRAVRMVTMTSMLSSLQLLVKCLASSRDMLFWSFCLLTFVQCVAGMILSTLCADFIQDQTKDATLRQEVYRYYGTFTRTFLSMFEIMFANWGPPCRVLIENVSEWFSIFFLLYRCVLGFAVLNVVNAVFVQQTMRTASSDEELAYKTRQKEIGLYTKKVKRLFQTMDSTGDGAINLEEFSKLVQSPKLKFWMSQLELEYHDLLSLFEFLDNGDGQITLTEFIDGAARLRGSAKAIDVCRLETKLEVLFEEVFQKVRAEAESPNAEGFEAPELQRRLSVQDVFHNSLFKFMKSTQHDWAISPSMQNDPDAPKVVTAVSEPAHSYHR